MGGRVVVGVDDSAGGRAALEQAVQEARLREAHLEAVMAFESPAGYAPFYAEIDWSSDRAEAEKRARKHLGSMLRHAGLDPDGDDVSLQVREGVPAGELLEAAKDADLLVVGSRGRGGFTGMLLGSVSQHVVRHAPCPVLVVPTPHDS